MAFTTLSCVCFVAILAAALGQSTEEVLGTYKKFEYEYRVLQDLVNLKNNQTRLLDTTAALTTQLQEATSTISNLQSVVRNLNSVRATSQSTYVRWGRTGCPGTEIDLIYSGYAAGSYYGHHGGAAEYLCMPQDPKWTLFDSTPHTSTGLLYGVEYEYAPTHQSFFKKGTLTSINNHEVPCAVCMTSTKTTSLMIPGRNTCYDGWKVEYSGYLGSGHYGHAGPSEYICVDGSPEITNGSIISDLNGKMLYMVETRCGSLPCPPYVNGGEVTCVVCSINSALGSP